MKYLLLIPVGILLFVGLAYLVFNSEPNLGEELADINSLIDVIEADKQPNGKYKYISFQTIKGINYRVDEYLTGANETGYIIVMEKEESGITYQKKVVGGPEQFKAHDWIIIQNDTHPTSTQ